MKKLIFSSFLPEGKESPEYNTIAHYAQLVFLPTKSGLFSTSLTLMNPSDEFPHIRPAAGEKACVVSDDATIRTNEVFERMKALGKSLGDLVNDSTDYRQNCAQLKRRKNKSATSK